MTEEISTHQCSPRNGKKHSRKLRLLIRLLVFGALVPALIITPKWMGLLCKYNDACAASGSDSAPLDDRQNNSFVYRFFPTGGYASQRDHEILANRVALGNPDPKWDPLLREAVRLEFQERDFIKARSQWKEVYDLGCRDLDLLYHLAGCCYETGAPNKSKAYLLELVEVAENDGPEYTLQGQQAHAELSYFSESEGDFEKALYHATQARRPQRIEDLEGLIQHMKSIEGKVAEYKQNPNIILAVDISVMISHDSLAYGQTRPPFTNDDSSTSHTSAIEKALAQKDLGSVGSWLDKAIEFAPLPDDLHHLIVRRIDLCLENGDYRRGEELIPGLIAAAEALGHKPTLFNAHRKALRILFGHAYAIPTNTVCDALVEPIREHVQTAMAIAREIGDDESMYYFHWIAAQNFWSWTGNNRSDRAAKELEKAYQYAIKNNWNGRAFVTASRAMYMCKLSRDKEGVLFWADRLEMDDPDTKYLKITTLKDANEHYERYRARFKGYEDELAKAVSERELRNLASAEKFKGSFFPYIACCLIKGLDEEAFLAIERANAISFSAMMGKQARERRSKVVASQHADLKRHQDRLVAMEQRLARLDSRADADQITSLQRDLALEGQIMTDLSEQVEMASQELLTTGRGDVLRLAEIQSLVGDATLIEYCGHDGMSADKSFIAVVTADSFHVIDDVNLWRTRLEELGEAFIKGISASATRADPGPQWEETCREIYDTAFKPVRDHIKTKEIIIVPYGGLNLIPFGCLKDENGKYLAEQYAISYAPSGSALRFCQAKRKTDMKSVLVLANPHIAGPGTSLKFAEFEAESVARRFRDSNILMGTDATESAFVKLAADYDVLHLACHGVINQSDPMLSNLHLAKDTESDGLMNVREIFNLNLNANLVTLSACNTGTGELTGNGFESMGMTRAFLFAGTPSVLATLWSVDDRATSELMELFYKNLLRGQTKSRALQQAQCTLMRKYDNPYYWAAFVLHGDYR